MHTIKINFYSVKGVFNREHVAKHHGLLETFNVCLTMLSLSIYSHFPEPVFDSSSMFS